MIGNASALNMASWALEKYLQSNIFDFVGRQRVLEWD